MPERLLLVGMMGAGKSTVGRLVAQHLGWEFRDVDEEVERSSAASVPEIFAGSGEAAFRELEGRALARCLAGRGDAVVAVGGGAVLSEANRARMAAAGTVVWLRARPETLAARIGDGADRPLLAGGPDEAARRVAELTGERAPLYQEVADLVIDVDAGSADEVAARLLRSLRPEAAATATATAETPSASKRRS